MIEEIAALAAFGAPQFPVRIDGGGRHHQMDMGMEVEAARMRMEHRNRPGLALEL
nr:hypothetical protein [Rhabdochromatium marinum]